MEELLALREATQALHRRLDALIGDLDGDAASDPRIVEIARRAIAELQKKQRRTAAPVVRNVQQLSTAAPSPPRNSERKPRGARRQP
jgi:hypothetical protein